MYMLSKNLTTRENIDFNYMYILIVDVNYILIVERVHTDHHGSTSLFHVQQTLVKMPARYCAVVLQCYGAVITMVLQWLNHGATVLWWL